MYTCRTCLKTRAEKDISELQNGVDEDNQSSLDIMLFCLNIKVAQNSEITTKLCNDCYSKIISFYKFKTQSLKNDVYLKSLDPVLHLVEQKLSEYVDKNGIKVENMLDYDEFDPNLVEDYDMEINAEVDLKDENILGNAESDEEALSLVQKIKYEYIQEEITEAPIRNTRGQRKKEHVLSKKDNGPRKKEHVLSKKENGPRKKEHVLSKKENFPRKKEYVLSKKENGPRKKVRRHKTNAKQEQQMCLDCGKYVNNLKQHSLHHKPKHERQTLQCKECPKVFFTKSGRNKHYRVSHLGKKSKCDICNKEVVHLSTHKLLVHDPAALPFGCAACASRFVSKSALDFHMTKHTKVYPFECDICHMKFRCKSRVARHIRGVHEKEKKFKCHLCPKAFFQKMRLETHKRSHTNERPYECEECGKAFRDKKTLSNHLVLHSDVRRYSCTLCDMTFQRVGYLSNHMISHTKEKKHPCQYCGVRFGRSDHRRRHEYTAHEQYFTKAQKKK